MTDNIDRLWQIVAQLQPRLRQHVQIYPQDYRGERWYLLHDETAGNYLRFNQRAYAIIGRLDGELTLEDILEHTNSGQSQDLLTQQDVISIISQLSGAELLADGLPINAQDIFQQYQKQQRKNRQRTLMNPLAIKLPLFNPNQFLDRILIIGRFLFSQTGLWIWLMTILGATLLAIANANTLMADITSIELSPSQILTFWLIFPVVKALHEIGHGLAIKTWGGEVRELGINFLVFMPVPYVDATASWGFRDKRRRMVVGAAGIFVELFLAALGVMIWAIVEPGFIQQVALNVILIGSISTLLFNGNPLLRFDGYFIFEDLLEIPNLATRARRYYLYLIQHYLLRIDNVHSPVTAAGETSWLLFYGFASPLYRLTVTLGIALYLIDSIPVLGFLLASWAIIMQLVVPAIRGFIFLFRSEQHIQNHFRGRAIAVALLGLICILLLLPVPLITHTQGIVWMEEQGQVLTETEGFVENILKSPDTKVKPGDVLFQLRDPVLMMQQKRLQARRDELHAKLISERSKSRVQATIIEEDLRVVTHELEQIQKRVNALLIRSKNHGYFVISSKDRLIGRFVRQGDVLGYIIDPNKLIIRTVLPQSRIGLLRTRFTQAEVMLADQIGIAHSAQIIRETPMGNTNLPSAALGVAGGGEYAIETTNQAGTTATQRVFHIELQMAQQDDSRHNIGGRVYVRLNHGSTPLFNHLSLYLGQLFLSRIY